MWRLLFLLLISLACFVGGCGEDNEPQFPDAPKPTGEPGDDMITLTWGAVDRADSYKLYRSDAAEGEYVQIWAGAEATYADRDVSAGKTYFYKVTSVGADGKENDMVSPVSIYMPFPQPKLRVIVRDLRRDNALADVMLTIKGEGFSDSATTGPSGEHIFKLERDGVYTIYTSKSGYMPKLCEVDTSQKDRLEVALKPIPKAIKTIKDNVHPFRTPAYVVFSTDGNRAFVTNRYGNDVSVIDASSDRVLKAIDVGENPLGLAINPKKPQLYVVNHQDGTISIIDTRTEKVIGHPVEVGKLPTHAVVNSDGTELYVVNSGENTVSVVDLTSLPYESDKVKVGQTPYGIAVSRDSRRLFVTNEFDNTFSIVSLPTRMVECVIPAGNNPRDIAYVSVENPADDYIMVSNYLGMNITMCKAYCDASPEIYKVGRLPAGIAIVSEQDGSYTAYIALKAEAVVRILDSTIDFQASNYSPAVRVVDESIPVGASPVGVAAHPNGDKIYVVNSDENSVTVLGISVSDKG